MRLYDTAEIERIESIKKTNDKMEEYFDQKRDEWNKLVEPLFDVVKNRITIDINDQITFFLNKRSKEEVKYKKIKQDKFVFYSIGDGAALKTNSSEKATLMDAHLAESDRSIQLIESYVEFLRGAHKNLEGLGFTFKQIIELMNLLGK